MSQPASTTTDPRPKRHKRSISEETNVSRAEAITIVKRWESNRELRPRPGQPEKGLSEQDRRRLVQIREEWPWASVREIWDEAGVAGAVVGVGVRTVSRFLRGVEREKKRVKRDGVIRQKKGGKV